jgi:hypothetical protein
MGFKVPDFGERKDSSTKAKSTAIKKFRASAASGALAERLAARSAAAAERRVAKNARDIEQAIKTATDAERALENQRDAAVRIKREEAERANSELALKAHQKAQRDARYAARKSRGRR